MSLPSKIPQASGGVRIHVGNMKENNWVNEVNIVETLSVSAKGSKDLFTCLIGCILGSIICKESWARVTLMVWDLRKVVTKSQWEQALYVCLWVLWLHLWGWLVLENAGCWLIMYGLAYSLIPYLISPTWKWFLLCGEHLPRPLSEWCVLVASVLAGMSVCPPHLGIWR